MLFLKPVNLSVDLTAIHNILIATYNIQTMIIYQVQIVCHFFKCTKCTSHDL